MKKKYFHTYTVKQLSRTCEREANTKEPPIKTPRPKTRLDCAEQPRPCPWVGCRHNLYLEVSPAGTLIVCQPGEPGDMVESCVLDVVDKVGNLTLAEIGILFGITRERIRQIEEKALLKVARSKNIIECIEDFKQV